MPQFDATIKHLKDGVNECTVAPAVKNIEGWEASLEKVETSGAKTIVKDLESLKKNLHAEKVDGAQVKKLGMQLGEETLAITGKVEGNGAEKIKAFGEALSSVADGAETEQA